ncbi:MAG: hypothetical protein KME59_19510, partial [Trichormus sp. ATA11-4-KO1]|nr:hypothetical protein [Trichormus sp. ATA11-4-KO1]
NNHDNTLESSPDLGLVKFTKGRNWYRPTGANFRAVMSFFNAVVVTKINALKILCCGWFLSWCF